LALVSRSLFLLFLLLISSSTFAQQLTGQARYSDTNQAAFNVVVKCDGTGGNSQTTTDRSGNFRFNVSPGHYTVSIRMPGYQPEERAVDLIDTQSSEYLFFRLKADASSPKPATATTAVDPDVPPDARKEFDKAETAFAIAKKENTEEGIRHLEKALSIYPKFVEAELRLGTAYMDLGQWDKAEQALKKTIEIDPKAANAEFALGEVYLRQKKSEEAEKVLLQGLQNADASPQAHLTLARVYWERALSIKDETQARPFLEKSYDQVNQALKFEPNLAGAHLLKGNLLMRVRRAPDALKEFEEYLRIEPKGQYADQTREIVQKIKTALNIKN
jgi:tetratricopeptide (TPR) repeat protein